MKNEGFSQHYLRNVNVRWHSFDLTDLLEMCFKREEQERFQINKGDIVICEGGEPGRGAIWQEDTPIMYQKALHRIRCLDGAFNEYVLYVIEYYANREILKMYFTGSTIKHLTGESLSSIYIPLPPIQEQKKIVKSIGHWLSFVDSIEENKDNLQDTIKQAKSKILDLAIHGKLVPQDPNDEPALELLKRINPKAEITCDNGHSRKLPQSWCICRLKDLCTFLSRGKSPKYSETDKTYPVFAQKCNLKDGGISLEQAKFLDPSTICKWSEEYKLKTGDVLVNSTGTGTVGRTRLFHEKCLGKYPFIVPDSHVSVIRVTKGIIPQYLYAYISSNRVQQYIEDNLAGSTNQKELYIGVLEQMEIFIPPFLEQQRIVQKIEVLFSSLDDIQTALEV